MTTLLPATILVNFNLAKIQADNIEQIASNVRKLANSTVQDAMQELSTAWKGESASAFLGKADLIRGDIVQAADSLDAVAQEIRSKAKRIYDAEMEAFRLSQLLV